MKMLALLAAAGVSALSIGTVTAQTPPAPAPAPKAMKADTDG